MGSGAPAVSEGRPLKQRARVYFSADAEERHESALLIQSGDTSIHECMRCIYRVQSLSEDRLAALRTQHRIIFTSGGH
ncbi:hypothetical protein F2P79_022724 [Pimephales promelas]|nr:hypothetical protein F2P79_022724 [Pimephales promelas]